MTRFVILALSLLALSPSSALAQTRARESYAEEDRVAEFRANADDSAVTDLSGDTDVLTSAGIASITTYTLDVHAGGRRGATIGISGRMSVASATATVVFVRGYVDSDGDWTTQSHSTAVLTAHGTYVDTNGDYLAPVRYFDTQGAVAFKVLVVPSSGTVDVWIAGP